MSQTVNLDLNQTVPLNFTATDTDGNSVPAGSFTMTASFSDPSVASFGNNPWKIVPLKLGTTTVTWTATGNAASGYTGSASVGPDTITVNPKTVASVTASYGTPQ